MRHSAGYIEARYIEVCRSRWGCTLDVAGTNESSSDGKSMSREGAPPHLPWEVRWCKGGSWQAGRQTASIVEQVICNVCNGAERLGIDKSKTLSIVRFWPLLNDAQAFSLFVLVANGFG